MFIELRNHNGHLELWVREGNHLHHKSTVAEGDTVKIESFLDTRGHAVGVVAHKDFYYAEAKGPIPVDIS